MRCRCTAPALASRRRRCRTPPGSAATATAPPRSAGTSAGSAWRPAPRAAPSCRTTAPGTNDDAQGRPLALLAFNDELPTGEQKVPLTVFGKLLRDARPAFPLTLRDVDGFLLHPDAFPDRSLLPPLAGSVHTTQDHPLAAFADAEWAGELRSRYLAEVGRDVEAARAQL